VNNNGNDISVENISIIMTLVRNKEIFCFITVLNNIYFEITFICVAQYQNDISQYEQMLGKCKKLITQSHVVQQCCILVLSLINPKKKFGAKNFHELLLMTAVINDDKTDLCHFDTEIALFRVLTRDPCI
jgi:hypothetical protein